MLAYIPAPWIHMEHETHGVRCFSGYVASVAPRAPQLLFSAVSSAVFSFPRWAA